MPPRPHLGPIEEELAKARAACRNWGRWGEDDVLGTLNFLDDAIRAHAASLVRRGRSFSLALEFNEDRPGPRLDDPPGPRRHRRRGRPPGRLPALRRGLLRHGAEITVDGGYTAHGGVKAITNALDAG